MTKKPLILITNDDGVEAQGIHVLTRIMRQLGDVVVVAPDAGRSGAACCITPFEPVHVKRILQEEGLTIYSCSGTPTDCAKLAIDQLLPRTPDLAVSGINHGDNIAINVHYSGTMGATIEACIQGCSSIGFSLQTSDKQCDFTPYEDAITDIARQVLEKPLPADVFLNVNFPQVSELKGMKWCRQARSKWVKEWVATDEPDAYLMTGDFVCLEPDAEDTDVWALKHGMAAIVPQQLDMTAHKFLENS